MRVLPYCSHALADIATLMNRHPARWRKGRRPCKLLCGLDLYGWDTYSDYTTMKNPIYRDIRSTPDWTHLYHRAIPLSVRKSDYGREAAIRLTSQSRRCQRTAMKLLEL